MELFRRFPDHRWVRVLVGPFGAQLHDSGWWVCWRRRMLARGSWPRYQTGDGVPWSRFLSVAFLATVAVVCLLTLPLASRMADALLFVVGWAVGRAYSR